MVELTDLNYDSATTIFADLFEWAVILVHVAVVASSSYLLAPKTNSLFCIYFQPSYSSKYKKFSVSVTHKPNLLIRPNHTVN